MDIRDHMAQDDDADDVRQKMGKVAVAAMLATTLSATPPNQADFPLPEAPPIVHVLSADGPDAIPDSPASDEQHDSASVWEKVFKILKYLLLILVLVATVAFAALQGCASCSGTVAAPVANSSSSSASA